MKDIITCKDLYVIINKKRILTNINLNIKEGEKIALLGASGAGKSTLISLVNGTIKPSIGKIKFFGNEIENLSNNMKVKIGTIWQDLRLIEELKVIQNINCGALPRKNIIWALFNLISDIETKECIQCLKATELKESLLNKRVKYLSGGQKQRVAIARLIRQNPDLLLADEPISNLDPKLTSKMLDLLLNKSNNYFSRHNTCIISLHRPEFIKNFSRVIGIKNGYIILDKDSTKISKEEIYNIYYKH